ncbi:MAG: hypothetical protein GEU80_09320 [Dehalococcoidia bacterium]|nr:hypothetical protein [Dehalococcoidia bacterium]
MTARAPRRTVTREPAPLADTVRDVVSIPTASFVEQRVIAHIERFAEERQLDYREDRYGNAYVTYQRGRAMRPLVLGAHTDHPGFVVTGIRGRRIDLEFRGGLSADYGKDEVVRIYGDGTSTARITSLVKEPGHVRFRERIAGARAIMETGASAEVGDMALWDVEEYRLRGDIVHARQCDDLIGVASVLATLDRLSAKGVGGHVIGLFTRAEEVGLLGAAAAARDGGLPRESLVVAVETSSMAGGRAEQGGGPIIRVGDLQHVFSSGVTLWMTRLARELGEQDAAFPYQRKLMDGGTTEATAYDLMGYETGAACIALGNYHNAGPKGQVRAETVHLADLEGLVHLFERMAVTAPRYERYVTEARKRWDAIARQAGQRLRATRV